jgi:hypothetical protein
MSKTTHWNSENFLKAEIECGNKVLIKSKKWFLSFKRQSNWEQEVLKVSASSEEF